MKKSIFITFEFGIKGDYDSLYKWLDERNAVDRGYGLAFIKDYTISQKISTDLEFLKYMKGEISSKVKLGNSDRIYIIWNGIESSVMKGGFIHGKSKQAPWAGYAQNDSPSLDLDIT